MDESIIKTKKNDIDEINFRDVLNKFYNKDFLVLNKFLFVSLLIMQACFPLTAKKGCLHPFFFS